jgi:hypothetical protein
VIFSIYKSQNALKESPVTRTFIVRGGRAMAQLVNKEQGRKTEVSNANDKPIGRGGTAMGRASGLLFGGSEARSSSARDSSEYKEMKGGRRTGVKGGAKTGGNAGGGRGSAGGKGKKKASKAGAKGSSKGGAKKGGSRGASGGRGGATRTVGSGKFAGKKRS